jgi:calcineurin-like phosphoesterase family protein
MIYFTADGHLGHANIIKFCNRPFSSIEEMDECIIDNWNSVVTKNDAVYYLGDFAWVRHEEYAKRLNGNKYLIKGNHDYRSNAFYTGRCGFRSVTKRSEISIEKNHLILDHYCLRVWNRSHYNSWHLYGHSHGRLLPIGKSYDVGVDNNNFMPVSYDDIKVIMSNSDNNANYIPPEKRNQC